MKIAIIGTGATGKIIAREIINETTNLDLLLADMNTESAAELAAALNSERACAITCDARNEESLRAALEGVDLVINAAHHEMNLRVMACCLEIKAHYLDLGGLYHVTGQQVQLHADFQNAELTAVIGMGAAPGLTNILANKLCKDFDRVESVDAYYAAHASNQKAAGGAFTPPYSIRTLLSEFGDPSIQFVDGELREFAAKTGLERVQFPNPIGEVNCFHTLHSEPATLPGYFEDRGIRRVTWRLALPEAIESALECFISAGLYPDDIIEVDGCKVSPVNLLSACIERNVRKSTSNIDAHQELGCLRVVARGSVGKRRVESIADCVLEVEGTQENVSAEITGRPAAAAALMVLQGDARNAGVHGPEAVVPPEAMLAALSKRSFSVSVQSQSD